NSLEAALQHDPTLHLTGSGRLLYIDPEPSLLLANPEAVDAAYPLEETFTLNSKPGSPRTIYLDFGDMVILDETGFNQLMGVPTGTVLLPYDIDGEPGSYSEEELANIQDIWARMAEDFA